MKRPHFTFNAKPKPVLSIVICTYNNERALRLSLQHLALQMTPRLATEVVVVDNNCTDGTAQVVHEFIAQCTIPRLRYVVETCQGQVHARVRGVRETTGDWIAFVDDDNLLQEGWIGAAVAFSRRNRRCGAFGGRIDIDWETPPTRSIAAHNYAYAALDLGGSQPVRLEGEARWKLRGAGLVCNRQALLSTGWLDWQLCCGRRGLNTMAGDDLEIVMRIARNGFEIWYEPRCRMKHLISTRRINDTYLLKLHAGFGLAHPMLTGMKRRQSFLAWGFSLLTFIGKQALRGSLLTMRATLRRPRWVEAKICWNYLCGTLAGIGPVLKMDRRTRSLWLGRVAT